MSTSIINERRIDKSTRADPAFTPNWGSMNADITDAASTPRAAHHHFPRRDGDWLSVGATPLSRRNRRASRHPENLSVPVSTAEFSNAVGNATRSTKITVRSADTASCVGAVPAFAGVGNALSTLGAAAAPVASSDSVKFADPGCAEPAESVPEVADSVSPVMPHPPGSKTHEGPSVSLPDSCTSAP